MLRAATLLTTFLLVPGLALAQKQITLLATVNDSSDASAAPVDPSRITVTENGAAVKVLRVDTVKRVPKVHVLVDNGVGLPSEALGELRKGLHGLIDALPDDLWVSIVTTSPQPRFIERGVAGRDKLHKAVDLISPDSSSGRFAESLYEATERIERDRDSINVIISAATMAGDLQSREGDAKKIMERIGTGRIKVHVVLYNNRVNTTAGGSVQQNLGEGVAKGSGGVFEQINVSNRLATLLPEIGAQVAKTMGAGAKQLRITAERDQSGNLGKLALAVSGMNVSTVVIESSK